MGYIGQKPTLSTSTTSGVWDVDSVLTQKKNALWAPEDPLFGKVTLLLQHTSEERGVCDKSLYKRPPTYNNMTNSDPSYLVMINTAYAPAWAGMRSLYFRNGYNHRVDFADSDDWTPNGDFTIEVVYWTQDGSNGNLIQHGGVQGSNWAAWNLKGGSAGTIGATVSTNSGAAIFYENVSTVTAANSVAHHAVLQRTGNLYQFGVDGNFGFSTTSTSPMYNPNYPVSLGCDNGGNYGWLGEIYAVRLTNAARYSGSTFPNAVTNGPFPTR